jgi:diaminopimelate epimerase
MEKTQRTVNATYHEGCGNDFLVVVDLDRALSPTTEEVQELCGRSGAFGADGLMAIRRGHGADLEMMLWNADGSLAEMSGNGIRCFAQAAHLARLLTSPTVRIETGAGLRTVTYSEGATPKLGSASVTMGKVALLEEVEIAGSKCARRASVGNPHLVIVVDDATTVDPMTDGPQLSTAPKDGTNVEWISPRSRQEIDLVVYERGAGPTQACGTGSCASAVVAHAAGLVDSRVIVHNPGGSLQVDCSDLDEVVLSGPVTWLDTFSVQLSASA